MNSRIVIIIFETENLFFPARGGYSAIQLGNGGGLRVVPSLRIVIRGPPRVNPPRGFGSAEGYVRRAVGVALSGFRFPVRPVPALSPAVQGLLAASPAAAPLCRPCPQVPVSLHAPASCSAWRPGGAGGVGPLGPFPARLAAAPAGGAVSPCGRPLFPGPWSCRGRSCPRSGADGVELAGADDGVPGGVAREGVDLTGTGGLSEHGPGVGAAGGRGPSIPPPGRTWRPGPKAELTGGMVSPEGSSGGAFQPAGYRKRCPPRCSAIFELTTGRVSWVSRIENVGT